LVKPIKGAFAEHIMKNVQKSINVDTTAIIFIEHTLC